MRQGSRSTGIQDVCVDWEKQGGQVPERSASSCIEHIPGEVEVVSAKIVFRFEVRCFTLGCDGGRGAPPVQVRCSAINQLVVAGLYCVIRCQ